MNMRPPMMRRAPMQQQPAPRPMQTQAPGMQMQRPAPRPVGPRAPGMAMQRPMPRMAGAAGSMGAAGMMMSDEHSKKRIAELEGELERTYAALGGGPAAAPRPQAPPTEQLDQAYREPGSYSYDYKDPSMPGAAPGRHVGPMAQELTNIPGVVEKTPNGLAVNTGRLTLANTSEVANQRRELDELERQVAAMGGSARPPYPVPR